MLPEILPQILVTLSPVEIGVGQNLVGELRKGEERFLGYFLIAWLYKVPLATQLVIVCALAGFFWQIRRARPRLEELFLLVPVVFLALYFNLVFRTQIGIRFTLVLFPLLYVFCGRLLQGGVPRASWKKAVSGLLLGYLLGSVILDAAPPDIFLVPRLSTRKPNRKAQPMARRPTPSVPSPTVLSVPNAQSEREFLRHAKAVWREACAKTKGTVRRGRPG